VRRQQSKMSPLLQYNNFINMLDVVVGSEPALGSSASPSPTELGQCKVP